MLIVFLILASSAAVAFVATKLGVKLPFADRLLMPLHKSLALWSQQANAIVSLLIMYIVQNNGTPIGVIVQFLPPQFEPFKGVLSGLIAFMAVSYLRLLPQTKLNNGQ